MKIHKYANHILNSVNIVLPLLMAILSIIHRFMNPFNTLMSYYVY